MAKVYSYPEAFSHLVYKNKKDESDLLKVWNSRDGIVPLVTSSKGVEYELLTREFVADEMYEFKVGDLVFVDMHSHDIERLAALQTEEKIKQQKRLDSSFRPTRKGKSLYKKKIISKLKGSPVLIKLESENIQPK